MAESLADLEVRVGWNDARFRQNSNRTKQQFNRDAASIEARARQLDTRLSATGGRFGRSFTNRIQQVGFQVGDFATQVAGGTNAITAMTQQGTQLLGAFGPWGAVIGAAGAVVGALAVSLLDAEEATDDLGDAMELLQSSASRVDDLNAQIAASSGAVREALIRERDATVELLEARLALAQETRASRQSELQGQISALTNAATLGKFGPGGTGQSPTAAQIAAERTTAEAEVMTVETRAELAALDSQIAIVEAGLAKLAAGSDGSPVFSAPSGSSRSGGGGRSRTQRDAFPGAAQKVQERLQALQLERQQIGLTDQASQELQAAFEREKLERELIAAAQKDGTAATEAEIALAKNLAGEVESLTISIFNEKEALDAINEATKQAKKDQDELARSVGATATKFISAVQNAESFEDALKNIGLQLLELAANAAFGQGPLGGAFNNLLGVSANGLFGLSSGPSLPSYGPPGFAKGAAFSEGQVIPFASGGIVTAPTRFPMRGGTGLMGEAGPEAIMPLSRGADGKLGVAASGGGSSVTVNIRNEVGGQADATMNGNQLDVVIKRIVASDIASGGPVHRSLTKTFQIGNPTTRR